MMSQRHTIGHVEADGYRSQRTALSCCYCFFARVNVRLRSVQPYLAPLTTNVLKVGGTQTMKLPWYPCAAGVRDEPTLGRCILPFRGGRSSTDHVHAGYSSGEHRYQGAPTVQQRVRSCPPRFRLVLLVATVLDYCCIAKYFVHFCRRPPAFGMDSWPVSGTTSCTLQRRKL